MIERGIGVVGIAVLIGIAWLASTQRRAIRWGPVGIAFALQLLIAAAVLRTQFGIRFFHAANDLAVALIGAADHGIEFVFGSWPSELLGPGGEPVQLPYVFAIRVLPIIIFLGSLFSILFHLGVVQRVVDWLARGLRVALRISGAESLATIANVFVGMSEAPLLIRPYVAGMTRSELFCVMVAGLATVAGSVLVAYVGLLGSDFAGHLIAASFMSAPAAVAMAKIMVPEEGTPITLGGAPQQLERETRNLIDAAAQGAAQGLQLALNVGAMLIAFVALVYLLDGLLLWAGDLVGLQGLSFERLLGIALAPIAFLIGVPWADAPAVGSLLGIKTVLNEFLAYQQLAEQVARGGIEPRSAVIASYALCGFANFGSLAILLGALGGIAPSRRHDVARDGLRAILAGSLATFVTGAIAGLLL
ncbi:MAG: nucleoside transporter C-terminal domain-containing protein [Myxococcota bacterium]|nr:nucleoside transporter C-terminal domain-containing protein [Myxococcota bacterium]